MPIATTISTDSHHHRHTQLYGSHSSRYQASEDASSSTLSDPRQGVDKSARTGGHRRVRAEVGQNPPEEQRARDKGAMSSPYPRRTYSESKTSVKEAYVKEPKVVVREGRRKSESDHRHHHRRPEREDGKESERVYVYKARRKSEGETDPSRPSAPRRSTTNAGEASRARHERQRTEDRDVRRRHSERKSSHHEERLHASLRHEKRSIAEHVPKSTRDRTPITRYEHIPSAPLLLEC